MPGMEVSRTQYGEHSAQIVELTRPDGRSRGTVAVIHGGFWRNRYDWSLGAPLAADLAGRGWTILNVEYRRVGDGGGVPATLSDVAAALGTLGEQDTSPLVTLGHSAGGQLAVWAASAGLGVTHAISQAGVLDLTRGAHERLGDGAVQAFVGGEPDDVPDAYGLADPSRRPLDVPVWCVHARDDEDVPFGQSEQFVRTHPTATLVEVTGGHFGVIDPLHPAWAAVVAVLDAISAPS